MDSLSPGSVPRPAMSKAADRSAAAPSFEKALAELEKIVARMEGGNLSLEESLAAHKRGLELAKFCQDRLEAAQQQVLVLEGEVLKPLAAAAEEGEGEH
ncbi:MAG: exodeoxyribonuclease VII small subunit [Betaproteobacteria bacterium]